MDEKTKTRIGYRLAAHGISPSIDKRATLRNLTQSRDLLARPYGWVKGSMSRRNHKVDAYCSLGAITKVDGKGQTAAMVFLTHAIDYSIIPWNDNSARKKKEVIQAFNDAIQLVEEYTQP